MSMKPDERINYLIALYLNNELSGEEKERMEHWCAAHPEEYAFLRKAYHEGVQPIQVDTDKAWRRIRSRVEGDRRMRRRHWIFSVSMVASVCLLIGMFVFHMLNEPKVSMGGLSAEGYFVATDSLLLCSLPDGSSVLLQKGASLSYDWRSSAVRKTHLKGVAYFEVKPNAKRRFSVLTSRQEVTVLGTSFVINSDDTKGTETVWVHTGKVKVRPLDVRKVVVLSPGESSSLDEQGIHVNRKTDPNNYGWATHVLVFQNRPLSEVFAALEISYGTKIALNPSMAKCLVTATFRESTLEEVLGELSVVSGFKYEKTNDGYRITEIKCP